jgi:predicted nucleic acid-binding protein
MIRALIDVNVPLDVLLNRQPFYAESKLVWEAQEQQRIEGHLAATAITNLYYIAHRQVNKKQALQGVRTCLDTFGIVLVDRKVLERAYALAGADFEDDVVLACALEAGLDAIVTRDPKGFAGSQLPVWSPAELLKQVP